MMLFASGVNFGFRRTIPHMFGIGAGFLSLLIAVGLGLGALLHTVPMLYTALKFAGGAYLVWIAWKIAHVAVAERRQERRRSRCPSCRRRPSSGSIRRPG